MSTENDDQNDGEWDDPSDLTRLEDLSEFLHQDDPDVEARLKAADDDIVDTPPNLPGEDLLGLDDLDGDPDNLVEGSDNDFSSEDVTNPDMNFTGELESTPLENEDETEPDSYEFNSEDSEDDQFVSTEEETSFGSSDDLFNATNDDQEDNDPLDTQSFDEDEEDSSASFLEEETEEDYTGESFSIEEDSNELGQNFTEENEEEELTDSYSNSPQDFALPDPKELEDPPFITAATQPESSTNYAPRENFQDLRDFGNAITYGVVTTGGNPPYSLILRQIKFEEDAEDIKIVLREHGLLSDDNEETIDQGLDQGSLLISQISEYSAIYLAHKLRRFDVEMRIGLSDQLHPSKSYSREGRGLVSKFNLHQNKSESLTTINSEVDIEDIKITTTPTVDGYNIHRYIEVITSHSIVEEDELKRLHDLNQNSEPTDDEGDLRDIMEQFPKEESAFDQYDLGINEVYKELVVELRNEAFKLEANAVVGVNFTITPLMFRTGNTSSTQYKITCSGNAVWVVDQQ
ncbi:MAG: hypothetical protein K9K67_04380 [Bacteriovoracaceae bacterium]|nr:hypothetical protein [Bacteriovoracaceae bacterium]